MFFIGIGLYFLQVDPLRIQGIKVSTRSTGSAIKKIRALIKSGRVGYTRHSKAEMINGNIVDTQVEAVILRGSIVEGPYPDIATGDWKVNFTGISAGQRIEVVVALHQSAEEEICVVVTVIDL